MKANSGDRRMLLILPSAFLTSLGIGIVNLGMLFVVKESYQASPAAVGWFAALWSMAYFSGCILLRPLYRRTSARASMAAMNLGTALIFIGHAAFPGLASAFIAYGLYGLATALFWPRLMGWLSQGLEGDRLSRASSSFSFSWSLGSVIAPYLAGILSERNLFLPVWTAVGIFALTGVFILATKRLVPSPAYKASEAGPREEDRSTALRYPAWVSVFLLYVLVSVFFNIFPLFAKDELGLGESRIGFLLLLRALATTLGFWFFGRFDFWRFKPRFILLAVLLALALDLAFVLIHSPLLFALGLLALGFILALAYNNSMFYGASGAPDRERRMTIHEALLTAGQILGSIAGGAIYQAYSWGMVFILIAFLFVAGFFVQVFLLRRRKV